MHKLTFQISSELRIAAPICSWWLMQNRTHLTHLVLVLQSEDICFCSFHSSEVDVPHDKPFINSYILKLFIVPFGYKVCEQPSEEPSVGVTSISCFATPTLPMWFIYTQIQKIILKNFSLGKVVGSVILNSFISSCSRRRLPLRTLLLLCIWDYCSLFSSWSSAQTFISLSACLCQYWQSFLLGPQWKLLTIQELELAVHSQGHCPYILKEDWTLQGEYYEILKDTLDSALSTSLSEFL